MVGKGRAFGALVAVASLVALPASAGGDDAFEAENTVCTGPSIGCLTVGVSGDIECEPLGGGDHRCTDLLSWSYSVFSPLPGRSTWATSALFEWCPPGGVCRGVGVGGLITQCQWAPVSLDECGEEREYELFIGTLHLEPGQCMDVTLTGFVFAQFQSGVPFLAPTQTQVTDDVTIELCG